MGKQIFRKYPQEGSQRSSKSKNAMSWTSEVENFKKGGGEAKNVEFSELDPYNKNLK